MVTTSPVVNAVGSKVKRQRTIDCVVIGIAGDEHSLKLVLALAHGAGTNLGRMLAVTEALFGQMYLVTVVALLVGKFRRSRS
jgi:hypothetical protein